MKKTYVVAFCTLFLCLGFTKTPFAQDYDGAYGELFMERSPLGTQQTLDSNIRLRSMGQLNLPVVDESNTIGLFKYGGSPAGLSQDYQTGKAELFIGSESGALEDTATISDAYTGDEYEPSSLYLSGMGAIPFETANGSKGTIALSYTSDSNEADATTGHETPMGVTDLSLEPDFSRLFLGYGQRINNFIFGISFMGFDMEFADIRYKSGATSVKQVLENNSSEIFPSVGVILEPAEDQQLTVAVGVAVKDREYIVEDNSGSLLSKADVDMDGMLMQADFFYSYANVFNAGLSLRTGETDGDATATYSGTSYTGEGDIEEREYNLRGYFRPNEGPVSLGLEIKSGVEEFKLAGQGLTIFDNEEYETEYGFGIAGHFPENKGLVGVQYTIISQEDESNISSSPSLNEERDGSQISLGGEYQVHEKLTTRAGLRLKSMGEDPSGSSPELDTDTTEINLGLEFKASDALSFALAYANTKVTSDSNTIVGIDERELSTNTISLLAKARFGGDLE